MGRISSALLREEQGEAGDLRTARASVNDEEANYDF